LTIVSDPNGQRSETVRRANLSAIVRELHQRGPLSRSELVARTGLTRSAIRGLIHELVAAGFVTEERALPLGTPGRPSPVVKPENGAVVVLALEIAVDSLAAAVVGLGGRILAERRMDRPRSHRTAEVISRDLNELSRAILDESGGREALIGVGAAVAGVVRRSDGFVWMAPNLGWTEVPLGAELRAALDLGVPVGVANEADLGALAEVRRGVARGADQVLYVTGEVGVGGGILVDGQPLTGVSGYGGELGHIPVNPAGVACGCGSIGCWETEIGALALLRRAGRPTDQPMAGVEAVLQDARDGDPVALAALHDVGRWMGRGLAGLVNTLNPRLVVFGGLFETLYPFIIETVEAELGRFALRASREVLTIVPAALGDGASIVGAAELALEPFLADPARWLRRRIGLLERATA
jgi:predicted NBD/HSP70 family sugar kinase